MSLVPEKYFVEFKIYGLPPTTNAIGRKHWAVQAKNGMKWKELVRAALRNYIPRIPLKRAKLTMDRCSSGSIDPDNFVISFKPVIDGLVQLGVLENDKYENIGMPIYLWEKAKMRMGFIRIKVEEEF